jgi:hypothetical protein
MRGTNYHGQDRIEDRFTTAQKLLSDSEPKIVYLYIPELDQIAHAYGAESTTWLNQLEEVDSLVSDFVQALPKQAGAVLTADHGVIDIKPDSHVFLDELLPTDEVHFVGGDTRAPFIYLKPSIDITKVRSLLEEALGNVAYVVSTQELVDAGYWKLSAKSADVFPDLVLIARKEVVFYHRAFAKRKSLEMIGHHGALTAQEMSIPLVTFGF